jgi:hypothetical protein
LSHLYCHLCHATGRAIYPPAEMTVRDVLWSGLVSGVVVFVVAFVAKWFELMFRRP